MPDATSDGVDIGALRGHVEALDHDPARVDRLEQVDASQQGRLARTARSDQADDFVVLHDEVDPVSTSSWSKLLWSLRRRERFRHRPSPPADDAGRARSANRRTASVGA